MNIPYQLTEDDLVAFRSYVLQTRVNPNRKYIVIGIMVAFLVLSVISIIQNGGLDTQLLVMLCVVLAVSFFISLRYFLQNDGEDIRKIVRKNPKLVGKRTLQINPDGIQYITEDDNSHLPFDSFSTLEESETCLFLFTGKTTAFIVPKRALTDATRLEKFKEMMAQVIPKGGK